MRIYESYALDRREPPYQKDTIKAYYLDRGCVFRQYSDGTDVITCRNFWLIAYTRKPEGVHPAFERFPHWGLPYLLHGMYLCMKGCFARGDDL